MPRRTLQPPQLFDSRPWGFSQVSLSPPGTLVHVAGQVAWDAQGKVSAVGREAQLRQVLRQVILAVEAAGGSADDIQMLRLYMPGFQSGPEAELVGRVLAETFGRENPPASTWIGVDALAQPEYLVEVDAVAVIPTP
ncbi:RidA family protein [Ancylobacter polymorphus]|jgi:2-iminobutanoate/2-iminopropanoate deaminase|uniref:Enamine deaminase RidA (YjgF/YER057c/UK114 family) n=1 Tax=Ancylobacter polymorphus TaxID=223390 RepID=A0ABU0B7Z2_9HYPH|nr:RidA family protein [Ancylobacter polymorphus]MDQ0301948.1 enamine deaminase RidA (YjgF/YER057c/UK114 family) [Ancylobacter polymorphus]